MSFERKNWKRGDKLNIKELNRIEKGIAEGGSSNGSSNGGGLPIIECDFNIDTGEASNFSITSTEFTNLLTNNIRVTLKLSIYREDQEPNTLQFFGYAWIDTAQLMPTDGIMIFNTVGEGSIVSYVLKLDGSGEIVLELDH